MERLTDSEFNRAIKALEEIWDAAKIMNAQTVSKKVLNKEV